MSFRKSAFVNLSLAVSVTALCFLGGEWLLRISPLSDRMGWNLIAPVSERVAALSPKQAGVVRILSLGDSFAEWRDTTKDNFLRVAELRLQATEQSVELLSW